MSKQAHLVHNNMRPSRPSARCSCISGRSPCDILLEIRSPQIRKSDDPRASVNHSKDRKFPVEDQVDRLYSFGADADHISMRGVQGD